MKHIVALLCSSLWLHAAIPVVAQDFYTDFALVVQLPSYEAFITNLGDSPIRVDGYQITSATGGLNPVGWERLSSSGPEIVAALGPGADQFFAANPTMNSLTELNPTSSATWPPGASWSIGFPFKTDDPSFLRDAVFRFSSPDGLVLTGGTVIPASALAPAALLVIPEPSSGVLYLMAAAGISAFRMAACRLFLPSRGNRRVGRLSIALKCVTEKLST
jgi:hypothetical protein